MTIPHEDHCTRLTGRQRFRKFRDQLRATSAALSCDARTDNVEVWRASGPSGFTRFVVIIGDDGFDVFHESGHLAMERDVTAIACRIGLGTLRAVPSNV